MSVIRWSVGDKRLLLYLLAVSSMAAGQKPKPQVRSSGGFQGSSRWTQRKLFSSGLGDLGGSAPPAPKLSTTLTAKPPERGCNLRATQSQQADRRTGQGTLTGPGTLDLQRWTMYGSRAAFFSSGLFCVFTLPYSFIPDPQNSCSATTLNDVWT